jgi:hypothetical protein
VITVPPNRPLAQLWLRFAAAHARARPDGPHAQTGLHALDRRLPDLEPGVPAAGHGRHTGTDAQDDRDQVRRVLLPRDADPNQTRPPEAT